MNQWTKLAVVAVVSAFVAEAVSAQGAAGRGGRGGFGGRGGGGGFGGGSPIMAALDADNDGTLSSSEIANAVVALKKLDKNADGKISGDEMRPERGAGGGERGGRGGERGERGGRGGGFGGGPGGGGSFADRIMGFDENKDGKIVKSELPERMANIMNTADSNGDGALSKAEIEAMGQRFEGRRGGRGGEGGGRGGRGGQGQGGGRPERPTRPQ